LGGQANYIWLLRDDRRHLESLKDHLNKCRHLNFVVYMYKYEEKGLDFKSLFKVRLKILEKGEG
jgi:hypothetical protein